MPVPDTVFMFSGQGSQYFQMGKSLFDCNDTFRGWMVRLDDTVRQISGSSVIAALYSSSHKQADSFDRLLLTHPAIFMAEYALAKTLMHEGVWPDMVVGVSLGSFAAAAVAGFIDVNDALTAALRQAIAIEQYCEPGGMAAVMADPALFDQDFLCGRSELAAVNFSSHFVISARRTELAEIEAGLKRRNVSYQRLPVSFPFHSRWIDKAKEPFEGFVRSLQCKPGAVPLACCDQVALFSELSGEYFWQVVRNPIRFREMIVLLEQKGPRRYIDVGPAGTLATFLRYGMSSRSESTVDAIFSGYGSDHKNLLALLPVLRKLSCSLTTGPQ